MKMDFTVCIWLAAAWAALALAISPPAPACSAQQGQHVVLASEGVNPDVFVWDSRERLLRYVSGSWGSTKDVMQHTMLVAAGTLAQVTVCRSREARAQYDTGVADVYGVKLLTGAYRNHSGWVVAGDAHPSRQKVLK
jgi:hypothetical protein